MRSLLMLFVLVTAILAMMGTLSANPVPLSVPYSQITLFGTAACPDHTNSCDESDTAQAGGLEMTFYDGAGELTESPQFLFVRAHAVVGEVIHNSAALQFEFEFSGPSGVLIPTDVDMVLKAFSDGLPPAKGNVEGQAEVTIGSFQAPGGGFENLVCNNLSCPSNDFTGTVHFMASPNTVYIVDEAVEAFAETGTLSGSAASASIDPYIHIDSSFADAGNYQLLLSDGIGNDPVGTTGSSVPEPSSLPLAGLALGALALLRRKHRP
jgi:hypothetical protein